MEILLIRDVLKHTQAILKDLNGSTKERFKKRDSFLEEENIQTILLPLSTKVEKLVQVLLKLLQVLWFKTIKSAVVVISIFLVLSVSISLQPITLRLFVIMEVVNLLNQLIKRLIQDHVIVFRVHSFVLTIVGVVKNAIDLLTLHHRTAS